MKIVAVLMGTSEHNVLEMLKEGGRTLMAFQYELRPPFHYHWEEVPSLP